MPAFKSYSVSFSYPDPTNAEPTTFTDECVKAYNVLDAAERGFKDIVPTTRLHLITDLKVTVNPEAPSTVIP